MSIDDYLSEFIVIINVLSNVDSKIYDEDQNIFLLYMSLLFLTKLTPNFFFFLLIKENSSTLKL